MSKGMKPVIIITHSQQILNKEGVERNDIMSGLLNRPSLSVVICLIVGHYLSDVYS